MKKKKLAIITVLLVMVVTAWVQAANAIDQRSVLGGKVLAQGLINTGSAVKEGDVLVYVETLTGAVPAARANTDGKVTEVLVRPGDIVRSGDVLVRIVPVQR